MNDSQLNSLIRSGLKLAGAFLFQRGLTTQAALLNSEDVAGAILTIIGLVWSFVHHAGGGSGTSSGFKSALWLLALLPVAFGGCAFQREAVTINTPAVYNVAADASGHLSTNLVAAASVKNIIHKERIWLPEGYAFAQDSEFYGVDLGLIDQQGNPGKIKAGAFHQSARWTPTSTNRLFAPAMSSSGEIQNSVPFSLRGAMRFTSGEAQVAGTNSAAGAIVPGVPLNQAKP